MSLIEAVRALAETQSDAVALTDGDLTAPGPRMLYVNAAFERMTGYASGELLGRSPRILQGLGTSLAARKALARALRSAQPHETTLVNYRKSGEPYRCRIRVLPICDADRRLIGALAIEREIVRARGRPARR